MSGDFWTSYINYLFLLYKGQHILSVTQGKQEHWFKVWMILYHFKFMDLSVTVCVLVKLTNQEALV